MHIKPTSPLLFGGTKKHSGAAGIKTGATSLQKSNGNSNGMSDIKRMLRSNGQEQNKSGNSMPAKGIVEQSFSYSESIRAGRAKAQKTNLALKKLRYNFKSISSKIMQSKTSRSAKQVVGQAKREIIRLKRQRGSEDCDKDELEAAITHAQAMERLAKKKARHLEEEEMARISSGGLCLEEKDEEEEKKPDVLDELLSEGKETSEDISSEEQMKQLERMEELQAVLENMEEMGLEEMDEFMEEMEESMKDLLEESGLADALEELTGGFETDVDPEDLKLMKIKHRCKEMKDLAKADADYLKTVFQKMTPHIDVNVGGMSFDASTAMAAPNPVGIDISL